MSSCKCDYCDHPCNQCGHRNTRHDSDDPVYYKIHKDGKKLTITHLQSFDEHDYRPGTFLSDTKYLREEDAQAVIDGIKIWMAEEVLGL